MSYPSGRNAYDQEWDCLEWTGQKWERRALVESGYLNPSALLSRTWHLVVDQTQAGTAFSIDITAFRITVSPNLEQLFIVALSEKSLGLIWAIRRALWGNDA